MFLEGFFLSVSRFVCFFFECLWGVCCRVPMFLESFLSVLSFLSMCFFRFVSQSANPNHTSLYDYIIHKVSLSLCFLRVSCRVSHNVDVAAIVTQTCSIITTKDY